MTSSLPRRGRLLSSLSCLPASPPACPPGCLRRQSDPHPAPPRPQHPPASESRQRGRRVPQLPSWPCPRRAEPCPDHREVRARWLGSILIEGVRTAGTKAGRGPWRQEGRSLWGSNAPGPPGWAGLRGRKPAAVRGPQPLHSSLGAPVGLLRGRAALPRRGLPPLGPWSPGSLVRHRKDVQGVCRAVGTAVLGPVS